MNHSRLLILLLSAFLLTACTNDARRKLVTEAPLISQNITDDLGRKINLPNSVNRMISIAPNITEMIYALGAQDKLIARSQACNYPPEVVELETIMTSPQLDIEQLKMYEADLVITTDEVFSSEDIARLEGFDIPVYVQSYKNLKDIYRAAKNLGAILGVEKKASEVADSLRNLTLRITNETEKQAKYATLILISNDPLTVVGGTGFLNELIDKAGGKNIFAENGQDYFPTTVEEIIQKKPEYIILPSKNEQIYAQLLAQYPSLQNTPADISKQVFLIDPDLIYRPGPRMFQGLLKLTHILHSSLNTERFLE